MAAAGSLLVLMAAGLLSGCKHGDETASSGTGAAGAPTSTAPPAVSPEVKAQIDAAQKADSERRAADAARMMGGAQKH